MSTAISEALKALSKLNEDLTDEEILEKAKRTEELYNTKKEELSSLMVGLSYGLSPYKIKGKVKAIDIKETRKEVKDGFYSTTWKDILINTLVCEKNDGTEFTSTIEDIDEEFDFYGEGQFNKPLIKVKNKWDELIGLFNSYKKWHWEATLANNHLHPLKPKTNKRGFDIENFDPYNWRDSQEVGAAWAEISQHKDWQEWIEDNVKSISARAPEVNGKLEKARDFLGHDRVYPANTWGWSFAITFDKDKLKECPFKHLLSKNGRLCSVATVCALFKGSSYEDLFTSRDDGENEIEFQEETAEEIEK